MTEAMPGFIRIYHLTTLKHAKSDIENHHLKVATLADANDPFELLALNLRGRGHRDLRKALREFKDEQGGEIGMLCFSRTWSNPVLWSHYADGHKGAALGFDVRADLLEEVKYADELIAPMLDVEQDPPVISDELQKLLLVTKFRHWEYEDELRRFVRLSDAKEDGTRYFWRFDDAMKLREVILGPLCPKSELERVRALVAKANGGAVVSRARLAFGRFEVRPDSRYQPA